MRISEKFRSDKTDFSNDGDVLAKKYRGFGGSETWFDITSMCSPHGTASPF